MQVRLTKPHLQKFIDAKIKAGQFPNAEAVVEDALVRMMEQELDFTADDVAAIRAADAQIDRGEIVDFDEFAARMRRKYNAPRPD